MEQIIFIAIVVVVGLIRLIAQATEAKRNAEVAKRTGTAPVKPAESLAPRGAPQTEEERIRKFLEALGVPTSADPPPKVQPRASAAPATTQKRKILPVDPFPRGRVAEPPPPVATAPPPIPVEPPPIPEPLPLPTRETTVLAPPRRRRPTQAAAAEFEVRGLDEAIAEDAFSHAGLQVDGGKVPATAQRTLVARLATSQGLRDAIVLREIFGPPRSMQTVERP